MRVPLPAARMIALRIFFHLCSFSNFSVSILTKSTSFEKSEGLAFLFWPKKAKN
jgi:hypothetical protein